jgi:SnoaL-like polyketide cyclase
MGMAPTGNRVEITGISITRLDGGKIEEIWENSDTLGMMQQLGGIPHRSKALLNFEKPLSWKLARISPGGV